MPDLAFLVDAKRHARFAGSTQALLHGLEVELVLVEDPGEVEPKLIDRSSPWLVSAEAGLRDEGRSFAGERESSRTSMMQLR